jgi:hypothetical protein
MSSQEGHLRNECEASPHARATLLNTHGPDVQWLYAYTSTIVCTGPAKRISISSHDAIRRFS